MLECHMEELIAKFPEDFFPGKGFVADHHQRKNLIELKAQPLKIADADQVGRYKTALQEHGEKRIIMWLVSPRIPTHVRESLDDFSIEYEEIHVAKFRQVAEERGFLISEESATRTETPTRPEQKTFREKDAEFNSTRNGVSKGGMSIPDAMDRVGKRLQGLCGDRPIPRTAIIEEVLKLGNWPPHSIIPSDFCYNHTNAAARPLEDRVFLKVQEARGLY